MKESYDEGIATHIGPEPCGDARKGEVEALTRERAGQVFSREIPQLRDADAVEEAEGNIRRVDIARRDGVPRGHRPCARSETPCTGTGRSQVCPREMEPRDASGSPRTHADDERTWEVGQHRSTCEVPEQSRATGGGGDGGKGAGQREPATAKRVPDTEPERRAQCAGADTSSSKKGQEDAVHGAPAPRLRPGHAADGVLRH